MQIEVWDKVLKCVWELQMRDASRKHRGQQIKCPCDLRITVCAERHSVSVHSCTLSAHDLFVNKQNSNESLALTPKGFCLYAHTDTSDMCFSSIVELHTFRTISLLTIKHNSLSRERARSPLTFPYRLSLSFPDVFIFSF